MTVCKPEVAPFEEQHQMYQAVREIDFTKII